MSGGAHHVLANIEPRIEPLVTNSNKDKLYINGESAGLIGATPLSPITATSASSELSDETKVFTAPDIELKTGAFRLSSESIDEDRPLKVVVIGAGFSGIIAGIR